MLNPLTHSDKFLAGLMMGLPVGVHSDIASSETSLILLLLDLRLDNALENEGSSSILVNRMQAYSSRMD